MKRLSTKVGMTFVYIIIAVIVIVPIAVYLWLDDPAQSEEKAQKTCALAVIGMRYADFEKDFSKIGFKPWAMPESKNRNSFVFYNNKYSGNSCTIHVKDGVITSKESH